jgi:hypothetical protein
MNDALREAAMVDPDWARKEQRRQWLVKLTVAGTLLALAVGAVAFALASHDAERITRVETKVEHSACQVAPKGAACQQAKARSSKAANLAVTCIAFAKAGYPCPRPGSKAAEKGVMPLTSGHPGHSHPGPAKTGPTPHHDGNGEHLGAGKGHKQTPHTAPNPPPSITVPPELGTGGSSQGTAEISPPAPSTGSTAGTLPSTVEAVGGVVEHVEAEVLTPTLCTVRSLLKPCP